MRIVGVEGKEGRGGGRSEGTEEPLGTKKQNTSISLGNNMSSQGIVNTMRYKREILLVFTAHLYRGRYYSERRQWRGVIYN